MWAVLRLARTTYLVLLVGGRVLLVVGVVRGGGLGERGGGEGAAQVGRAAAAASRAAAVHLAALRQRHVRACAHARVRTRLAALSTRASFRPMHHEIAGLNGAFESRDVSNFVIESIKKNLAYPNVIDNHVF